MERHSDLQGARPRRAISDAARDVPAWQGRAGQAFYVDLFHKVTQTAEYKDYMEKQALKPIFLSGKQMLQFLEEDDTLNKSPLMTQVGFVARSKRTGIVTPSTTPSAPHGAGWRGSPPAGGICSMFGEPLQIAALPVVRSSAFADDLWSD